MMELALVQSLEEVLDENRDLVVLDFGGETEWGEPRTVLVGCEGGFSEEEREMLQNRPTIGFKTDLILKSETAAVTIAAKLLI